MNTIERNIAPAPSPIEHTADGSVELVRSSLFSRFPELLFGMSTALGGVSAGTFGLNLSFNVGDDPAHVQTNRNRFFSALGISESDVAFTQQQHTGITVAVFVPGVYPVSDALVTDRRNVFLSISSADCTPVMLYDPVTHTVAGIHAGWRGTSLEIASTAVSLMKQRYGTRPGDIIAFIGPSAGQCCYEVGPGVAKKFPQECSVPGEEDRFLLDVKRANVLQLLRSGVPEHAIEVHPDCSIHNKKYHSHRRDGKNSGRMFAIIGLRKGE